MTISDNEMENDLRKKLDILNAKLDILNAKLDAHSTALKEIIQYMEKSRE